MTKTFPLQNPWLMNLQGSADRWEDWGTTYPGNSELWGWRMSSYMRGNQESAWFHI